MKQWIFPYVQRFKGRILLSLLFGILGIGSGAMLLFVSGYLISKSALRPENIMIVYVPIVSVRAFSIGRAVFLYVEKLISHDLVLRILEQMRIKLYNLVEPQALFLRSRYKTGDLLGVLSEDIEHLQDLYLRTIFPAFIGLTIYTIIVIVIGSFDFIFAIMFALILGVLVCPIPYISYRMTRTHQRTLKEQTHRLYEQLTDTIFGMADWQASGRSEEFIEQMIAQDETIVHTEQKIKRWHYRRDAMIQFIIGISIIAMLIWVSIQAGQDVMSPTVIAAFVLMTFSVTEALAPLSEAVEHIPSYTDSIERIKAVEQTNLPKKFTQETKWDPTNNVADLHINNVSYKYPGSKEFVLNDLSLHASQGEKIAILGRSGTGKSTLLKLITGALQPTTGVITINGQKVHSGFLSEAMSVLNQKPHLFSTTIANNIRVGRPDASDEDILHAADQAQLTPLIKSLPQGIHTPMHEMGQRFSGGERQRIAFARVLLQQTPIILIDEATIGLDPVTEHELINTMLEATTDKTIIWVTHHLAGAEQMDQLIFLKNGEIAIKGSHEELISTNMYYQNLFSLEHHGL